MRIALTGGIGSGKSTVLALLSKALPSYKIFSVDDAVRAVYCDPGVKAALVQLFGSAERKEISDRVFADPALQPKLEALVNGYVIETLDAALSQDDVIVEFPLLFERGWEHRFDFVVGVGCNEDTRRARVLARDNISVEKYEQIVRAQLSTNVKIALSDHYVDTGVPLGHMPVLVNGLLSCIHNRALWVNAERLFESKSAAEALQARFEGDQGELTGVYRMANVLSRAEDAVEGSPHSRAALWAVWFHHYPVSSDYEHGKSNAHRRAAALVAFLRAEAPQLLRTSQPEVMLACEFLFALESGDAESAWLRSRPSALQACDGLLRCVSRC